MPISSEQMSIKYVQSCQSTGNVLHIQNIKSTKSRQDQFVKIFYGNSKILIVLINFNKMAQRINKKPQEIWKENLSGMFDTMHYNYSK